MLAEYVTWQGLDIPERSGKGGDKMLTQELQRTVKHLSRTDKLTLMHFILNHLPPENDSTDMLQDGETYAVWSPYGAESAARTLQELLTQESASHE